MPTSHKQYLKVISLRTTPDTAPQRCIWAFLRRFTTEPPEKGGCRVDLKKLFYNWNENQCKLSDECKFTFFVQVVINM